MRKAFVIVSHFGKLNIGSIKKLKMQDLNTPDRNGILVKIEDKQFLVPSKAIGQCNTISYSGLLNKYNEIVIQDTKQTKGPLFRHFFKSSKRFTRIPMGIAVMKKIRCEVAQSLGLINSDDYCEGCFYNSCQI